MKAYVWLKRRFLILSLIWCTKETSASQTLSVLLVLDSGVFFDLKKKGKYWFINWYEKFDPM